MTNLKAITKIFKQKSVVTTKELLRVLKNNIAIKRAVEAGEITSLGSGIYASFSLDPFIAAVIATSKFYPKAVISNITSLTIHGLGDERIDRIDVDIERSESLKNKLLHVHRVSKNQLIGISKIDFHGHKIRIYNLERSLCEAYKIDPAGPLFFKSLKRSLKNHKLNATLIAKYDIALKTKVLTHLQQELADD
jgi:predicted transcriptional regulator of viral defense system